MCNSDETNPVSRRIRKAAYSQAFLYGLGTGLFGAHLLRYLVRDLCVGSASIYVVATFAWIIAAPRLVGVFRLFVPVLLDYFQSRKRFCIVHFAAAPLLLGGIPFLLLFRAESDKIVSLLILLIVFWSLYHLCIYSGTVALFSWYGDLVPESTRGRFFGSREAWGTGGLAISSLTLGLYSHGVIERVPEAALRWTAYFEPLYAGLICLVLAALPLCSIPDVRREKNGGTFFRQLSDLLAPLRDRRLAAFVFFGCWVQMSQALTQGVQYGFSVSVIGITMLTALAMSTTTRLGQWAIGSTAGKLSDRFGTVRVMSVSLVLAATGSLFYYFAETSSWYLLFGAAVAWIFWVGVNIGITKTILDLSPEGRSASYLAVYFTLTALTFALFTIIGGYVIPAGYEKVSFLWSFGLRLLSVPILWIVLFGTQKPRGET